MEKSTFEAIARNLDNRLYSGGLHFLIGVLRRNPRFFRHLSFSPATSASRSIISLLLWKM
ncbi:hypothetical protein CC898_19635 [Salmonella enterica subsp. enterica serovar Agona]|nr:hypothetical protein [Salmonella enterica subsp. enterica serovar Agona]